jgi:hypothetical protein
MSENNRVYYVEQAPDTVVFTSKEKPFFFGVMKISKCVSRRCVKHPLQLCFSIITKSHDGNVIHHIRSHTNLTTILCVAIRCMFLFQESLLSYQFELKI